MTDCLPSSEERADVATRFAPGNRESQLGAEARHRGRERRADELLGDWPERITSETDAKRRCEIIADLAVRGLLAGSQAGAAVRAIEVWLKVEAHEIDVRRMRDLEAKIAELEAERARRPTVRSMP